MAAGKRKIHVLTHGSIRPYGMIIDGACVDDKGKKNSFGILMKERSKGWRIGYLVVREKTMKRLENHPDSFETFEPVVGTPVMALSSNRYPEKIKLFLLDKPVVVKRGVWHAVVSHSGKSEIKIFENIEVEVEYHTLKESITA